LATETEIREARELLGNNPASYGWDDDRIATALDAGDSATVIARKFWESRAARSADFVDVAESGSSRRMGQIATNSAALAAFFRGQEQAEDPANQPGAVCRPIRRV
jgi:hypothetical protein